MKVLLLNPPFPARLTRRYMCTYVSATSLFPPYELLSVAGVVKGMEGVQLSLMDCVAREMGPTALDTAVDEFGPDVILTILGLDSFQQDVEYVNRLKAKNPDSLQVIFGHYPTTFPDEILANCAADVIIKGEPDEVFGALLQTLVDKRPLAEVPGICYRESGSIVHTTANGRIKQLDRLPMPAYEMVDTSHYFETLMPGPFTLIQTSRGCPFTCNYCVTTFGNKFIAKSAETVLNELVSLKREQHIRSFRIIDDTFTVNKKRVIEICKGMVENNLRLKWTCLSRTDTLTEEMLHWMKKAGCTRIYFGLESGSQRMLDYYKKSINLAEAAETLRLCRKVGVETAGFFMAGLPIETPDDFEQTIRFAQRAQLTFAMVGELTLYPGTELYEMHKDDVEFSLFPYVNRFRDKSLSERFGKWREEFHRRFYYRPQSVFNLSKVLVKEISPSMALLKNWVSAPNRSELLLPYIQSHT